MRSASVAFALLSTGSSVCAAEDANKKPEATVDPSLFRYLQDIDAYGSSLANSPAYTSVLNGIAASDPDLLSSLANFEATAAQDPTGDVTAAADFFTLLPAEYRGFFESVYSVQRSIALEDGVLTTEANVAPATAAGETTVTPASTTVEDSMPTSTTVAMDMSMSMEGSTSIPTTGPITSAATKIGKATSSSSSSLLTASTSASASATVSDSAVGRKLIRRGVIGTVFMGFLGWYLLI